MSCNCWINTRYLTFFKCFIDFYIQEHSDNLYLYIEEQLLGCQVVENLFLQYNNNIISFVFLAISLIHQEDPLQ